MAKMHISKSINVKAPVEKVYEAISDFNHWAKWSPWLIQEPEATVNVAEDSKYYEWEGKRLGTGNMQITGESTNEWVDYDLTFLKPWKSTAKVRFELERDGEETKVTWLMDSGLPFFLFWMKKMMTAFIGMDYERGLNMLKDYAEDGEVHSKLDFKGETEFPGCKYVGIRTQTGLRNVGPAMQEDFGKMHSFFEQNKELIAGEPFSQYHKWDVVKEQVAYTSAFPVSEIPSDLPEGFVSGEIPATRVYTVAHKGPYAHLGNAWSTLYNMQRSKVFKSNKKINPFETYLNMPGEVPDNDLVSAVHFPVK